MNEWMNDAACRALNSLRRSLPVSINYFSRTVAHRGRGGASRSTVAYAVWLAFRRSRSTQCVTKLLRRPRIRFVARPGDGDALG